MSNNDKHHLGKFPDKMLAYFFVKKADGEFMERGFGVLYQVSPEAVKGHLDSLCEMKMLRRTFHAGKDGDWRAAEYEIAPEGRRYCKKHGLDCFS